MPYKIERKAPPIHPPLRTRARNLRNQQTEPEYKLWYVLRGKKLGVKFRRQQIIGRYVVDFYCSELRLVIEADGGQHNNIVDAEREAVLKEEGLTILRFWNNEITENITGVMIRIQEEIERLRSEN